MKNLLCRHVVSSEGSVSFIEHRNVESQVAGLKKSLSNTVVRKMFSGFWGNEPKILLNVP